MTYEVVLTGRDGKPQTFKVERGDGVVRVNGQEFKVDASSPQAGALSLLIGGQSYEALASSVAGEQVIVVNGHRFVAEVSDPRSLKSRRKAGAGHEGPKKVIAPMPGKVIRIVAAAGTEVAAGDGVVVIEAMKMQNELKSPKSGKVAKIAVKEGDTVNPGDTLAVIE